MDPTGRTTRLYHRLPTVLQNAALTLGGLRLRRIRYGPAFHARLAELRESDHWERERIEAYQDESVAALAAHAYRTTAYYRRVFDERGLTPADIRGVADLPKLPILTKDDIRRHHDELVSSEASRRDLVTTATSGSTARPLSFLTSRDALAFKWAVWWRHRERFGFTRGDLHAKFNTKPLVPPGADRPPFWRWDRGERQAVIPMQQVVPSKAAALTQFLDETPFRFYASYPSIIQSLASQAAERGLTLAHGPRVIFTGAERMFDDQMQEVAAYTGAEISQLYGFNEGAANASMCEAGVLHEDFEFGVIERVTRPDEASHELPEGSVIATGFATRAFPLLRYDVGDVARWRPEGYECPCGRKSRVIDSIVGRLEDYIVTPEGHRTRRLGQIFTELPELKQFQIVQEDETSVLLRVVVGPHYSPAHEDLLRRRVAAWLSPVLEVSFEYVDVIDPGPGGKYHRIVNRIDGAG